MKPGPILSLFPGIGLLDRAFESLGMTVVRGPDLLWGGDIRKFKPGGGWAWGVMGGSPCQDFSAARRDPPTGNGLAMIEEFRRVVKEARPEWWLLENVPRVPDVAIAGYTWQRIDVELSWYSATRRLRHFQFGSWSGVEIEIPRGVPDYAADSTALASNGSLKCTIAKQGLPSDFALPGFTRDGARRAIGNGVPIPMGTAVAGAIATAYGLRSVIRDEPGESRTGPVADRPDSPFTRKCECGCGRKFESRKRRFASDACRKRANRRARRVPDAAAESGTHR